MSETVSTTAPSEPMHEISSPKEQMKDDVNMFPGNKTPAAGFPKEKIIDGNEHYTIVERTRKRRLKKSDIVEKVMTVYICNYCGVGKSMPYLMANHLQNVHFKGKCRYCQKSVPKRSLKGHIRKYHKNGQTFQCPNCEGLCKDKIDFKEHTVMCCGQFVLPRRKASQYIE